MKNKILMTYINFIRLLLMSNSDRMDIEIVSLCVFLFRQVALISVTLQTTQSYKHIDSTQRILIPSLKKLTVLHLYGHTNIPFISCFYFCHALTKKKYWRLLSASTHFPTSVKRKPSALVTFPSSISKSTKHRLKESKCYKC